MTTLHALRRSHKLSLSELARLTGISVRRLAEYEYESRPLGHAECEAIAAFFQIHAQSVTSGIALALPAPVSSSLQPDQAHLLAALAAAAALTLALRLSLASPTLVGVQPRPVASVSAPLIRALPASPAAASPRAVPTSVQPQRAAVVPIVIPPRAQVPAAPDRCPIEPKRGSVVTLAAQGVGVRPLNDGLDLAVDTDGDGYAELSATRGATVVAAHAGTVTVALDTWPAGNYVVIDGADGWRSDYAHLQVVDVQTGEQVIAGQHLGVVGNTGQVGGPHLNIGIWHNGSRVDPTPLLHCK